MDLHRVKTVLGKKAAKKPKKPVKSTMHLGHFGLKLYSESIGHVGQTMHRARLEVQNNTAIQSARLESCKAVTWSYGQTVGDKDTAEHKVPGAPCTTTFTDNNESHQLYNCCDTPKPISANPAQQNGGCRLEGTMIDAIISNGAELLKENYAKGMLVDSSIYADKDNIRGPPNDSAFTDNNENRTVNRYDVPNALSADSKQEDGGSNHEGAWIEGTPNKSSYQHESIDDDISKPFIAEAIQEDGGKKKKSLVSKHADEQVRGTQLIAKMSKILLRAIQLIGLVFAMSLVLIFHNLPGAHTALAVVFAVVDWAEWALFHH